jgi:O-antigen/teichoic acid export membrane protein
LTIAGSRAALKSVIRSPAITATIGFAVGGVGFALAQLLLARALTPTDFAVVSLLLSMNQVGFSAGTMGIEVPINRHRLPASRALLRRTVAWALPIAAATGLIGLLLYRLDAIVAICLVAMVVASTANMVASALYRSTQQFGRGLLLTQLQNYALLLIACIALAIPAPSARVVAGMIVLAYGIGAAVGWRALRRRDAAVIDHAPTAAQVHEGLMALGFTVAVMIMVQFERLVIPGRLAMSDLAIFSVAAALAASPFRMLQIGVGFTLLPRLRACKSIAQVRGILLREAAVVAFATIAFIATVWLLTPYILRTFLQGRYALSDALLFAIFTVGAIRVGSAFAVSSVQALGEPADFRHMTVCAWLCVLLGGFCGLLGAQFGLQGVIYGIGIGWLALAAASAVIAVRASLRWVGRS